MRRQAEDDRRKRADLEVAAEKSASQAKEKIKELESSLTTLKVGERIEGTPPLLCLAHGGRF